MTRLVVATGFMVAFCAGLMVGLIAHRRPMPPEPGPGGRASWIANQLDLSADQAAKMKEIWQDVSHHGGPERFQRRGQIRRETDDAVSKLIRPEDRAAYDQCMKDGRDRMDALDAEGRRAFGQAVEKTKAMLTPEQRTKYEALLARPPDNRPGDNRPIDGRPGDGWPPEGRPASRPGEGPPR